LGDLRFFSSLSQGGYNCAKISLSFLPQAMRSTAILANRWLGSFLGRDSDA
jgi:hypothetical protein